MKMKRNNNTTTKRIKMLVLSLSSAPIRIKTHIHDKSIASAVSHSLITTQPIQPITTLVRYEAIVKNVSMPFNKALFYPRKEHKIVFG